MNLQKEARIEVLESQLEVANAAKDERMIQSIVDAYKEQHKISRDHMDKIHEEQQKFTKEQVEIIKKQQQEQAEKSHSVEFSEKQPAKSLAMHNFVECDKENDDLQPCVQQPHSCTVNNQVSNIHSHNMTRPTGMPTTISAVQHTQARNFTTCGDPRCNSRSFCVDCEYNLPQCSSSAAAVPFQPVSIPASNVNQPTCNTSSSFIPPAQFQQHYQKPASTVSQLLIQQPSQPARQQSSVPSIVQSNNAAFYTLTSPVPDHPTVSLWSNRLKPSPVATVAPQVKNESLSPENNTSGIQEIDDSNQEIPEAQHKRSRRVASSKQGNQPQPRRYSARVQARGNESNSNNIQSDIPKTVSNVTRSKMRKIQEKKNQQQKLPKGKGVHTKQTGRPNRKTKATTNLQQQNQQQEQDIYEFEEEAALEVPPPAKRLKTSKTMDHVKSASNRFPQRLQSNPNNSDYKIHYQMQTGSNQAFPDWVTQPEKNIMKKSSVQRPKSSDNWIVQDSGSTEYDFQDESQSSEELSPEQFPSRRTKGNSVGLTQ